jgi:hypothetical protein
MLYVISLKLLTVVVSCVDTDLHESEKAFESEFSKRYGDKEDEKLAAEALSASENQVKLYFKVIGLNDLQR